MLWWLACIGVASGEILMPPPVKGKANSLVANEKPEEASALRNKAQAYKSGSIQSISPSGEAIIIHMDEAPEIDEGVLLPRSDETSAISRSRKYESSRDNMPGTQDGQSSSNNGLPADRQDIKAQLEKNRLKATQYMNGKPVSSQVSASNDAEVDCASTGNVSGRIGDDSLSGREIIVVRDGKKIKMRCK